MASSPRANHHYRRSQGSLSASANSRLWPSLLSSSSTSTNASPARPGSSHSTLSSLPSARERPRSGSWAAVAGGGGVAGRPSSTGTGRAAAGASSAAGRRADDSIRQSNITVFEWRLGKLQALEAELNSAVEVATVDFEILNFTPVIGGGAFKVDVQCEPPLRTPVNTTPTLPSDPADAEDELALPRTLSLYLSSLTLDYGSASYGSGPTSIMVGIKQVEPGVGTPAKFLWQKWEDNVWFTPDTEFWRCELPSLSDLLQTPAIEEHDACTLVVQLHTPPELLPESQDMCFLPRALLQGLENSLDNSLTGDVKFICRERERPPAPDPLSASLHSRGSSSAASLADSSVAVSPTSVLEGIRSRKRVLYAHSDILKARSDYFDTMLSGAFAEGTGEGERRIHVVNVEDTDFSTLYWLLRYLYSGSLEFAPEDDVRVVYRLANMAGGGPPQLKGVLEWDWQPIERALSESVAGGDAESTRTLGSSAAGSVVYPSSKRSVIPSSSPRSPAARSLSATTRSKFGASGTSSARSPAPAAHPSSGSSRRPSSIPVLSPARSPSLSTTTAAHQPPGSPGQAYHPRTSSAAASMDPRAHPTPAPPAASALSCYHVASRYQLPELEDLCVEHICKTLRADTAMSYLLATSAYDDLQLCIQDFVVDFWPEISLTSAFELANAEVAAGVWGEKGGKVLTSLFRRLHSPNAALRYAE